jgi:hypothetical protein
MRGFLPQEHGAYGQVAVPLITALGVAGVSRAGLLLSAAVIAGFLAHEPAAIMLGVRGARAQRELGARATWWLGCCLAIVIISGIATVIVLDPLVRWSLSLPAIPALLLVVAMVLGREKSWYGEAAVALACTGVAVPVSMGAGAPIDVALAVRLRCSSRRPRSRCVS